MSKTKESKSGPRTADFCPCFLSLDLFSQRVHLRLPTGKDKYQTFVGALISVLYAVTLISFSYVYLIDRL